MQDGIFLPAVAGITAGAEALGVAMPLLASGHCEKKRARRSSVPSR